MKSDPVAPPGTEIPSYPAKFLEEPARPLPTDAEKKESESKEKE